jgi:hypothetical protein
LIRKKSPLWGFFYYYGKGLLGLFFLASKNIEEYHKWECEYFFEARFYPKECWIFFKNHFEKSSKLIGLLVCIKRINQ